MKFTSLIKIGLLVALLLFLFSTINNPLAGGQREPIISIKDENGNFLIKIREEEKEKAKLYLRKIKSLVYSEATIHNPSGDVLPDNIDNKVIEEVKERVN